MNLKGIIEHHKKRVGRIQAGDFSGSDEGFRELTEIGEYFNRRVEQAVRVIGRRLEEDSLHGLVSTAQTLMLTTLVTNGGGEGLSLALEEGELTGYTNSVVLGVIGVLLDEEVL